MKDKATKQGLPGVNIVIEGTSLGAATDPNGDYFILSVPPGMYKVTASMIGYGKLSQTEVRVPIDHTTPLNFELSEEILQAGEVTIIAERPRVELDLTASKETMTREEIANTWGKDTKDVVADIPGANINGGIRGSFGGDVSYRLDGIDLRDVASNTKFSGVNMSTVQEVEVLTGGWNAEYGQANGSIVNIVSRKATDRLHAITTHRTRPPGKYHWGRNIYDENDVFHTVMRRLNSGTPPSPGARSGWLRTNRRKQHQALSILEPFEWLVDQAVSDAIDAHLLAPVLDSDDIQLAQKWMRPQQSWQRNELGTDHNHSSHEVTKENCELGRLFSARVAEKAVKQFFQESAHKVEDISIRQIRTPGDRDWVRYDLLINDMAVDVKNARRSNKNENTYAEYLVPNFKLQRADVEVLIAGTLSALLPAQCWISGGECLQAPGRAVVPSSR